MRTWNLETLVDREGKITPQQQRREDEIEHHGVRCAAWLIRDLRKNPKTRASFRASRAANVVVYKKHLEQLPVWFGVACETLRRRKGWYVTIQTHADKRVYCIRRVS